MKNKLSFILLLLTASIACKAKDTICITLKPSDTTGAIISTQDINVAGGPSNLFYSATWTCSGSLCLDRGLMKFDLSAIPNKAIITNATLSLYADNSASVGISGQPTYGSDNAGWLQRVTSVWFPNTVTWNTQPTTTLTDEVTLTQSINTSENYVLNVTQLVQDIMNSGNNYGFEILQQDENAPYESLIFGSSINKNSNLHPQLQICYVTNVAAIDTEACGDVFVPNVFAPDKSVYNDVLYVRGACITSLHFLIFDRWGNKVFESQNINNGWDGTHNGQPMNTDTYIWYLKATMQDGTNIEKKGNVTLVR